MYCSQCGKEINEDVNFCSECGNRINYVPQHDDIKSKILNDIAHGKRVACNDGCCTGTIGTDGVCRTCGKSVDWIEDDSTAREAKTNELKCPRCSSTKLTAQKKGFGLGKAAAGGILLGGVCLLGGVIGSGKIRITCLKCGHSWEAGTA